MRHACEIRPDGVPGDVLAEPDGERARGRRQVVVDVAERDEVRAEVRDLDADSLLAGDRSEDADLGRRERVREVVLEGRDLRDLRSRRKLQLVARHARPGDLPADRRFDAEVRECLDEHLGDVRSALARGPVRGRRDAEDPAVGKPVLRLVARRPHVEERRLLLVLERDQQRRGRVLADHVGVVVHGVDRRRDRPRAEHRQGLGRSLRALEGAARSLARVPHRVPGTAEDRAGGGARQQQRADEHERTAEDSRAGRAEEDRDQPAQPAADDPAVT